MKKKPRNKVITTVNYPLPEITLECGAWFVEDKIHTGGATLYFNEDRVCRIPFKTPYDLRDLSSLLSKFADVFEKEIKP